MTLFKAKYGNSIGRTRITYSWITVSKHVEARKRDEGKSYKKWDVLHRAMELVSHDLKHIINSVLYTRGLTERTKYLGPCHAGNSSPACNTEMKWFYCQRNVILSDNRWQMMTGCKSLLSNTLCHIRLIINLEGI